MYVCECMHAWRDGRWKLTSTGGAHHKEQAHVTVLKALAVQRQREQRQGQSVAGSVQKNPTPLTAALRRAATSAETQNGNHNRGEMQWEQKKSIKKKQK